MTIVKPEHWIGSKIGKYHILRELGRGGMGEVYLAEDSLLGRRVAIKRLLPIFAEDEDFVARFKREARSVSRLNHPGIVTIHSLDWISGMLLLDMEYVDGTSLYKLMQTSVVTPAFTAQLARDVLDALAACHENGIVHRDIKPSNILLTDDFRAKLVDFGIATALADSTATQLREGRSTTIVLGTPRFMAPEAWDGAEVSPQWDLFALGVVLYECLSGEIAFKGTTTSALARQITNEPLPKISLRAPGISAPLAHLVDNLVAINPAQRCSSAHEALRLLADAPEMASSASSATVRRSPAKRVANSWRRVKASYRKRMATRAGRWVAVGGLIAMAAGLGIAASRSPQDVLWVFRPAESASGQNPALVPARSSSPEGAYTLHSLSDADSMAWQWWIARQADSKDNVVIGYSPLGLLRMTMSERQNTVYFSGEWAAYANALARGFRTGAVSGQGRWQGDQRGLALTLEFENSIDGTTTTESFLAEPQPGDMGRDVFLRGVESAEILPTLIYYALEPRNMPLGDAIQSLLPANGQRVYAPLIKDSAAPVVDGHMDDETWRSPVYGRTGRVGELNAGRHGQAYFRQTGRGLYLGIRLRSRGLNELDAEIGILQGVASPPRFGDRALLNFQGFELSDRKYFQGPGEVPFPETWEIAASVSAETGYAIEVFIPFPDATVPTAPWRFNAVLSGLSTTTAPRLSARWGNEEINALEHGALIDFREPQL